jgi:6-phosphofructokinase
MRRDAGWIAGSAGLAGGADVIAVPPNGELVRTCRALGISFGDERQLTTVVV